ncbi:MAG TPA: hypothetical protein VH062_03525 [Polyangiaceae bacterium]|nr:hypothetical protein [Polyangiaceae bacterium]
MGSGGGKRWRVAALVAVLLTGCDLNPRPEDPGANDGKGANMGGAPQGAGGVSLNPPPVAGIGGTSGTTGSSDHGESVADAGAISDAGTDATTPSDASPDAQDAASDALNVVPAAPPP